MHLEQQRGRRADGAFVVGEAGPVGRADLDDLRPRGGEDLRDAERAADLDQLAARDDDLAPRASAARASSRAAALLLVTRAASAPVSVGEQPFEAAGALAAAAGREIDLEVAGGGLKGRQPRRDLRGQRRTPEVGVQEDPGGVQHPAQGRSEPRLETEAEALRKPLEPVAELRARRAAPPPAPAGAPRARRALGW